MLRAVYERGARAYLVQPLKKIGRITGIDLLVELEDPMAYGWVRNAKVRRGFEEAEMFRNGQEVTQPAKFHRFSSPNLVFGAYDKAIGEF